MIKLLRFGAIIFFVFMSATETLKAQSGVVSSSNVQAAVPVSTSSAQWYMLFTKGKSWGLQSWMRRSTWPSDDISTKWKDGYYITDVSYGGPTDPYFITFSKKTSYTNQLWRTRTSRADAMKTIEEIWRENPTYKITSLKYINSLWIIVATEGTGITDQIYLYNSGFPGSDISSYWDKKYDVSDMSYDANGWLVIMSQGLNFKNQGYRKYETTSNWDYDKVAAEAKESGLYLSFVEKFKGTWYAIYTKDLGASESVYKVFRQTPINSVISEQWDKGFKIEKLVYIPSKY